ncbi:MAG: hypothetical protein KC910_29270 [Candidatus Eremiobacteraeota bacterium]|nr:hypothetical protein [Candidatus Eremiobacteraeota bacterium]
MTISKSASAFTLIEILVVCFLSVIVLLLMMQLMLPSVLLFKSESSRSEAQQNVLILVHRLESQLVNSQLASVTISPDDGAIAFQQLVEADPFASDTGKPKQRDYFTIYFYDATAQTVYQKRWPPGPPSFGPTYNFTDATKPQRLSQAHLEQICSTKTGDERVVGRHITTWEVNDDDDDPFNLNPPLRLTLTCSVEASGQGRNRFEEFTMTSRITPRNVVW